MNRHGHMNISWKKDILIGEVQGPFNEVGLKYWFSELQSVVENRACKTWKRLEVWDEEVLGSPETLEIGHSLYDWYEENGCIATAVVVSNSIQEQIITGIFKSKAKIFRDKEDALNWLENISREQP